MKKLYFLIALLSFSITGYSQNQTNFGVKKPHRCYFDEKMQARKNQDPAFNQKLSQFNKGIAEFKNSRQGLEKNNNNIIIPVCIRLFHTGTTQPENIPDSQILSQINVLNEYFDTYGIQFCLASTMTNGTPLPGPTPGIMRVPSTNLATFNIPEDEENLLMLPTENYLNIFIVKDIVSAEVSGQIQGYGTFPGQGAPFDGVIIRADVFGNVNDPSCTSCITQMNPELGMGKILVHEVGHYLGLYHTFEQGCYEVLYGNCHDNGDMICDTPPVKKPNSGCPTSPVDSCSENPNLPDDINNFMDYTNETCLNSFTNDQKIRMLGTLYTSRSMLISPANLIAVGVTCIPPGLIANITADNYAPCAGTTVNFTSLTIAGATYSWNFGDNTTATTQNASHSYVHSPTPYTVTLTVTLDGQSVTTTKQIYTVNCSPINNTDSSWFFGTQSALSFQTGTAIRATITNTNSSHSFTEGAAVQSSATGQLLFYTNGIHIFNAQQQLTNQSNPMMGNRSAQSGVLIVPDPGNASQYYIFTKDARENTNPNGFRSSKVQMNGSAPTLVATNTPITIPAGCSTGNDAAILGGEGITAVQTCNGYWIITVIQRPTGFSVAVYQLNANGLTFNSEFPLTSQPNASYSASNVQVSPDGNRLLVSGFIENGSYLLYDFNKNTGIISNEVNLNNGPGYGSCFSPNSQLLYVMNRAFFAVQYNLNVVNIPDTRIEIGKVVGSPGNMQLGPDNKIYISQFLTRLAVIHQPNNIATVGNSNSCYFSADGPLVQSQSTYCLPNIITAKMATAYNNTISVKPVNCYTYRFNANVCGTSFNWNFGDTASSSNTSTLANPTHTFSGEGPFEITLTVGSTVIKTNIVVGIPETLIVGNDAVCIQQSNQTNHSTIITPGQTAQWSITSGTGAINGSSTTSSVTIHWTSLPGTVKLTVTDAAGCTSTTEQPIVEYCEGDQCPPNFIFEVPEAATTETYKVSNSITTKNNYQVASGKNISLIAASYVRMKPDTHIKPGSVFLAKIAPCVPARPSPDRTAIEDPLQRLTVYPNPTEGELNLSGTKIKEIYLFDVLGKDVFYSKYDNVNTTTIDISRLQQGIYFMKVVSDGNIIDTVKVIKD